MGVGTSTGHILLYDIRSSRPLLVKDHYYGIPIKKLFFHSTLDQVVSLDAKSVKTHCRRVHQINDYQPVIEPTEAQFICQVRGCGKLFVEAVQIGN